MRELLVFHGGARSTECNFSTRCYAERWRKQWAGGPVAFYGFAYAKVVGGANHGAVNGADLVAESPAAPLYMAAPESVVRELPSPFMAGSKCPAMCCKNTKTSP